MMKNWSHIRYIFVSFILQFFTDGDQLICETKKGDYCAMQLIYAYIVKHSLFLYEISGDRSWSRPNHHRLFKNSGVWG